MALDIRKTYPKFGRCIYCHDKADIPDHLGDEHIIPLSFGGERLLPKASCRKHEKITTRFEDHCFKGMINTARHHMRLKGRHLQKKRDRLPVIIAETGEIQSVPVCDHPSALIMPLMPPPTAYIMKHESEDFPPAARLIISPVGDDMLGKARKIGRDINLTRGLNISSFYRLIAKIAHSFAMAELGPAFEPYLINLIEGAPPMFASHLVGSGIDDSPIPSEALHEIDFADSLEGPKGIELIQVRIRLFANLGMPNHYAIVGARRK